MKKDKSRDNKSKKNKDERDMLNGQGFIGIILAFIVLALFSTYRFLGEFKYGEIGDYINGIATPILTFVALVYAYNTYKKQNIQYAKQRFSDTFFQLLNLQNNIIDNLKYEKDKSEAEEGRNIFKGIYFELIEIYNKMEKDVEDEPHYESILEQSYRKLDFKHKDKLSHYYKNLYQIFNWIEINKNILSDKEKYDYVKFIRAQLSFYEIHLLYFNSKYYYNRKINEKNISEIENESFFNVLTGYNFFQYDESYDETIPQYFDRKAKVRRTFDYNTQ